MKKRQWIPALIIYLVIIFSFTFLMFIVKKHSSETTIDINWYRNYYNIVSSIISTVVGITGIILGLFYYFDKERRNKTSILKKAIEEYDLCVKRILKLNFKDEDELNELRIQIESINDNINLMLDNKIHFLRFSDEQVSKILQINSLVNKSSVIMSLTKTELETTDRASVLDVYEAKLQEVLLICYGELR